MRLGFSWLVRPTTRMLSIAGAAVAALATLTPGVSQAIPYSFTLTPNQPFQRLSGAGVASLPAGDGIDETVVISLPPGFTFKFYENTYSTIYLNTNGLVLFNSADASTVKINSGYTFPTTNTVKEILALWWAFATCPGDPVKTLTRGQSPAREFVVELRCHKWNTGSTIWELQLILTEGSSTIKVHYGDFPPSGRAEYTATSTKTYVGIENKTATEWTYPRACGSNCLGDQWPENTIITYSQGPELSVTSVSAPVEAFAGISFPVSVGVRNAGGEPAVDFTTQLWLNTAPNKTGAIALGAPAPIRQSANPGDVVTFNMRATVPLAMNQDIYYIIAEVDPDHVVPVSGRGSTIRASAPFPLGLMAPNLTAVDVVAPAEIQPGRTFDLSWVASNIGNAPANRAAYQVVLSAGETPTASSRVLDIVGGDGRLTDRGYVDIDEMIDPPVANRVYHDVPRHETVFLPADVPSGRYWIGVRMDPDQDVFEHDRSDNTGVSGPTVAKSETSLAIVTPANLPPAEAGTFYSVALQSVGGDGTYYWKLSPGSSLPPGLFLEELPIGAREAGLPFVTKLSGTPSVTGTFEFSLEVSSGSLTKALRFRLEVVPQERALTIQTQGLPEAYFESKYTAHFEAGGGSPPYMWSLVAGRLPGGLEFKPNGTIEGRPLQDGPFSITVRVTDARGVGATRSADLIVLQPPRLSCGTHTIGPFRIGEVVDVTIQAGGGTTKYWELQDLWSLPAFPGESTKRLGKVAPPGLNLGVDGRVTGAPTHAGIYDWRLGVKEDPASNNPTNCMVRLEVIRDRNLTITTGTLVNAVVGQRYAAQLEATGGEGEIEWSVPVEKLPAGLSITPGGLITGTPSGEELAGEDAGSVAFTVRATDVNNRIGTAPLSIVLLAAPPPGGLADNEETVSTCQSVGADPSLLAVAAAIGLAAIRRRRR